MNSLAPLGSAQPAPGGSLEIDIVKDIASLDAEWGNLQKLESNFIYQNYDWVRIAYETYEIENEPVIVVGREAGDIRFIIPLVLVRGFPNILRWPGADHCNIGTGLFSPDFLVNPGKRTMQRVLTAIRRHLPCKFTVLHLKNQPKTLAGLANPMLQLSHQINPNPFYMMDLKPGMDAILDMGNGKRKRKLFRRQQRIAEKMGGYELVIPEDAEEIRHNMGNFFELKAERFAQLGVPDVFDDEKTRRFMLQLALHPERDGVKLLRLFVLKVAGKTRALYANGIDGTSCQCCVNAIAFDDFSAHSPGEMINYLMIEHLIAQGFTYFDLGLGQERYKASWCKNVIRIVDTIHPLGPDALPFSASMKTATFLKRRIKNSNRLWPAVKKLRQKLFQR